MTDRPLDCIGSSGPVGKHDFRLDPNSIRRVGSRPATPAPVPHTVEDHLDTAQRILEGFSRNRQTDPQYILAALDHLKAAREKLWPSEGTQPETFVQTVGFAMPRGEGI